MERTATEPSEAPPTNPRGLRLDRVPPPPAPPSIEQSPLDAAVDELDLAGDELDLAGEVIDLDQPDPETTRDPETAQDPEPPPEGDATAPAGSRRPLKLVAAATVCCLLGGGLGGGLALVDRSAVNQQRAAVPMLDAAAVAVQQVEVTGGPLDVGRTVALLQRIRALDTEVRGSTGGTAWEVARRTVRREPLTSTGDRAAGLALIADAAGPLQSSLQAVGDPGAGTPDALEQLARDLNRFASVSIRGEELGTWTLPARPVLTSSGGTAFERLATAAAILPTMAGEEAPRRWLICRSATVGCTRVVLAAGQVRSRHRVPAAARTAANADITLTGTAASNLLVDGSWSVPAMLNLLAASGDGEDDATPVVTSAVPVEQHALDVLAGRRPARGSSKGSSKGSVKTTGTGSRRSIAPSSTHA